VHKQLDLANLSFEANEIRKKLKPGIILSISGPMGVGKTTLIKHVLYEYKVNSPSFLHMLLYGEHFAHIDAYTFKSKEAFIALSIEELLLNRCIIIEWGELIEDVLNNLDAQIIKLRLNYGENNQRFLTYEIN
jgi:tRNA threonylcarbamoyl adenosine modification protein YjeE